MNVRRYQTAIGLACLIAMSVCVAMLSTLSRSEAVRQWAEGPELERFKAGGGIFMNRGHFVDFEERLLVDEIPWVDFSRGGVYFFGTSTSKWAMQTWALPDADRNLIRNFGIGATNHRYVDQFVHFLDQQYGLLAPGGDRVHVVIGCFWTMGKDWRNGFFTQLWARHGLYVHNEQTGITQRGTHTNALQVAYKLEQARLAGFVVENTKRAMRWGASLAGVRMRSDVARQLTPEDISRRAADNAEIPNWPVELQEQRAALMNLLGYLRERGVGVSLVMMPLRSIYLDMDKPLEYEAMIRSVALEHGVELVDFSRLLEDDEFVDVHHANHTGLVKLDNALVSMARSRLAKLKAGAAR